MNLSREIEFCKSSISRFVKLSGGTVIRSPHRSQTKTYHYEARHRNWLKVALGVTVVIGYLWASGQDRDHAAGISQPKLDYPKTTILAREYPDLMKKARRDRGGFRWKRFEMRARLRWERTHPLLMAAHRVRIRNWEDRYLPPRELGRRMAANRGWTGWEWTALERLWSRESGWRRVYNYGGSGACHIPQALPCSKIPGGINASNRTAIQWGLDYIGGRYGTPSNAYSHSNIRGWY